MKLLQVDKKQSSYQGLQKEVSIYLRHIVAIPPN